jgi:hypothetical protein
MVQQCIAFAAAIAALHCSFSQARSLVRDYWWLRNHTGKALRYRGGSTVAELWMGCLEVGA